MRSRPPFLGPVPAGLALIGLALAGVVSLLWLAVPSRATVSKAQKGAAEPVNVTPVPIAGAGPGAGPDAGPGAPAAVHGPDFGFRGTTLLTRVAPPDPHLHAGLRRDGTGLPQGHAPPLTEELVNA